MNTATTIRYVRPDELNIDHSYQRPLNMNRMGEKSDLHPFNPSAVGVIHVSERADSTLWLLDGQHRCEKARRSGHSRTGFPANVYTGLTIAQEAEMFRMLNAFKKPSTIDRFKARVTEGDKAAVILTDIARRHGWRCGEGSQRGGISAVGAMETVYDGARIRKEGGQAEAVERTIEILTAAYGHNPQGVKAELIHGLGLVILRHGDGIETAKLVTEMGKLDGGPHGLISQAKGLKHLRGGSVHHSMAEIIVGLHNRGRRTNRLPDWVKT